MTLRNQHRHGVPPALISWPDETAGMPAWLRAADHHTLPVSPRRLRAMAYYAVHPWYRVPKALAILLGRGVRGCWYECGYTIEGVLRIIDRAYAFGAALHHEEGVRLALGSPHQYRAKERHINARRARGILLAAALGALAILGLWLGLKHPYTGALAGLGLWAALDAIGRRGRAPRQKPPRRPEALQLGMPTSILWGQIDTFLAEHKPPLEHAIRVHDIRPDAWRGAFQVDVHTTMEIDAKLLRELEKWIRAPHGVCQLITSPTNAADKTILIPLLDPLKTVPEAPWLPAGSVSGWQPLDLGASANREVLFELILVMRHILLVAKTRGGKTVHLSNIIDRLSATRDVVVCAGALVKSARFDAWRDVLYNRAVLDNKAETVEEIEDLLRWAIAQIHHRNRILKEINSDDDPDNDVDKWNPDLGPAIVLVLDELPEIVSYDGTKVHRGRKPNLLEMVKTIMRLGLELGVSIIGACQASGNEDWGSSVVYKQVGVKIIGPCSERDTVDLLGKDRRDQGYAPHLLQPADERNPNDAGKAVVDGPGFGSDYVRGYAPFAIKARALRRLKEWEAQGNCPHKLLPALEFTREDDLTPEPVTVIDAAGPTPTPSGALYTVEAALNHYQVDVLASGLVLEFANSDGENWSAESLATALRKAIPGNDDGDIIKPRNGRCRVSCTPQQRCRCYYREDVEKAMTILRGEA